MPEEQTPFEPQEPSLKNVADTVRNALKPHQLAVQIGSLDYAIAISGEVAEDVNPQAAAEERAHGTALTEARHVLLTLQTPSINAVVAVMFCLDPKMQALVTDVTLALLHSPRRQNLAIALRKLIEARS